jgi:DNA invertase Pin-like site-specific DNA recombinase
MLIGYARVSKTDGTQNLDLQLDALRENGVLEEQNIYTDYASGKKDDRPGLLACLKALRKGDTLIVWKLDRLGRNLKHLVSTVHELEDKGIGFKVMAGHGANIDTSKGSMSCSGYTKRRYGLIAGIGSIGLAIRLLTLAK